MPLNVSGASALLAGMARIPSSLKWLIDIRARLDGEIKKVEATTARAQSLLKELQQLHADLSAVDRTLGLHDIKVELSAIQPVLTQAVRPVAEYGVLAKYVSQCLRVNAGRPVRTSVVLAFVADRMAERNALPEDMMLLHRAVVRRLKKLRERGVVVNHRPEGNYGEGLWAVVDSAP